MCRSTVARGRRGVIPVGRWVPPAEREDDGEAEQQRFADSLPRPLAAKYLAAMREVDRVKMQALLNADELVSNAERRLEADRKDLVARARLAESRAERAEQATRDKWKEIDDLMEAVGSAKLLIDLLDHHNWMQAQWVYERTDPTRAVPQEWLQESRKNINEASYDWKKWDDDIYGGEVHEGVPTHFPDYYEQRQDGGIVFP